MSHWFDAQAAKTRAPSPERQRQIQQIKRALGEGDREVHISLTAIEGYARALIKSGPDPKYRAGVSPLELEYFAKLRADLLRARDRLDALHTGLRAERELSDALTESAAAVDQWHRGMSTTNPATLDGAQRATQRHFASADRHAKAGLANLEIGR